MARYRDERSRSRWSRPALVWLLLLCVLLYGADRQGWLAPATSRLAPVLQPVTHGLTTVRHSVGGWLSRVFGASDLERENTALREQLTTLKNENLSLQSAELENVRLRHTAGMRERYGWRTVLAAVVGRSPDSSVHQLTIDRGSREGLQLGMPVLSHVAGSPDALIGTIDQLTTDSATVLLITDVRSVISSYVLARIDQTSAPLQPTGQLEGQWQLGSRLVLRQIEREAEFSVGDNVLSAGISRAINFDAPAARIPPDIPIGTVHSREPDGHGQRAEVQPYFDPDQVQTVWIIVGVD